MPFALQYMSLCPELWIALSYSQGNHKLTDKLPLPHIKEYKDEWQPNHISRTYQNKKKTKTVEITLENLLCYTKYEHTATFVSQKI